MDVDEGDGLAELVAQARAGESGAMDELLTRVRPWIERRCRRILPHPQDAEEATQDSLLAVATKLGSFSGIGSFEGWVNVIAANQARMTYRSLKKRFADRGLDAVPDLADAARTSVIAGTRLDLLDALEALEARHPETVEALVMRDLGSLSYDEIATATNAPLGTVKARIHTARNFLRERLTAHH